MSGKKSLPTQAIGKALVEEDIYPCVVLLQCQTRGTEPLGDEPSGLGPCQAGGHGGCSPLRERGTYSSLRVCPSNSRLREKRCIQTRRTLINTLAQACLRNLEKKPLKYIRHADERELLCLKHGSARGMAEGNHPCLCEETPAAQEHPARAQAPAVPIPHGGLVAGGPQPCPSKKGTDRHFQH